MCTPALKSPLTDHPLRSQRGRWIDGLRRNRGADRFRSPDPEWSAPLVHVREGKKSPPIFFRAGARVDL